MGGVVLAVLPWNGVDSGEGNHLWLRYDEGAAGAIAPSWAHFDHLGGFAVAEGQRVAAGQLLGWCSKSGGWDCSHLHCELARHEPASWWQWPYAWSLSQVQAAYYDPAWWYEQTALQAAGQEGDTVRTSTTLEEREAVRPYFEQLGYPANMDSGLMQLFCLSYYRDESPGPLLSDEYPAVAPDGSPVTRQRCTARVGEAKQQPDGAWWCGYVEVVLYPDAIA